jgi:hypothetical protein
LLGTDHKIAFKQRNCEKHTKRNSRKIRTKCLNNRGDFIDNTNNNADASSYRKFAT